MRLLDARGDVGDGRLAEVARDGLRDLLVEGQQLEALGGGDGDVVLEEVEREAVGRDVELVEVAEGFGGARAAAPAAEEAGFLFCGLLEDWLEDLEGVVHPFLALVEQEGSVLHAGRGEEGHVLGETLRCAARVVMRWRREV